MVAYNFKAQFAPAVESGEKRMTIRRQRVRPTQVGDALQLYTGMRTPQARKLCDTVCKAVVPFDIYENTYRQWRRDNGGNEKNRGFRVLTEAARLNVCVNGKSLAPEQIQALAHKDGFRTATEFLDFFERQYGLPFSGEIIEW